MPTYKTYCREIVGESSHHTSVVADTPEEAARLGLEECLADWKSKSGDSNVICVGVMDDEGTPLIWDENGIDIEEEDESPASPVAFRRVVATVDFDLKVPGRYSEADIHEITFDIPLSQVMPMVDGKATTIEVLGYTTRDTEIVLEEQA
jgi:hypothetical protein